jgi:DsbC/DsbD-like thiol-disulfide interchange protein
MNAEFAVPCRVTLLSIALMLGATAPCRAQDVSPWDADLQSSLRLIAGSARQQSGAPLRAGMELRLKPGWKTYWRYPGDSGLPPVFDFASSENVASITVLWPAPERFPDGGGGNSIGYRGNVIFPLHVVARDAAKPVVLRLKANYGVCETLCIPARGSAELKLSSGRSTEEAALATAEARVPKPVALGAGHPLAVRSARRDAAGNRARVIVDVTAPEAAKVDLFAEGPAPDWALPLPEPVTGGAPGGRRFAFDVDGLPAGAKIEGAQLKFTLVAGDNAIEVTTRLD